MTKNNSFKKFIFNTLVFAVPMSFIYSILFFNILIGCTIGILLGIIFSVIINIFIKIQSKKFELTKKEIEKNERIIFNGGSSHLLKKEYVGGWLFLTEKRLFFKSHKYNIQKHEISILLSDIEKAEKLNRINTIEVRLKSGEKEIFLVNDKKLWINKINNLIY